LREIWNREGGFVYTRQFRRDDLKGFCRVCCYGDICWGGCTWKRHSQVDPTAGDIYCFYYQAVKYGRFDLLEDEPTAEEMRYESGA
jgi:sulfatase maturation enzyme AslB (radical SAM superfamily)